MAQRNGEEWDQPRLARVGAHEPAGLVGPESTGIGCSVDSWCAHSSLRGGDRGLVVLPGGQIEHRDGETVTLPPPGADLAAVLLADGLGARACHVVVDQDSLDPRTRSRHLVHPDAERAAKERDLSLEIYSFRAPF